jgi:hypothetical protein
MEVGQAFAPALLRRSLCSEGKGVDFSAGYGERAKLGLVTFHLSSNGEAILALALAQDFAYLLPEKRNLGLNNIPDEVIVYSEITMDQPVSHACHSWPFHLGYRCFHSGATFFEASPITSRLRTKARFSVSLRRNSSLLRASLSLTKYSDSSRMWRRYSSGERSILDLFEDMRSKVGTEGFHGHDFDFVP